MVDMTTMVTYCAVVLGFVFIPGPATLLTAARATTSGTKVGIATGAGIAAGDLVHTFMAVVGISAVIAASAMLFSIVKYIGAAYLIYLGIRALLENTSVNPAAGAVRISAGQAFNQAILAEVLNPKTALFFLAFLPQIVLPANVAIKLQLIILGNIFVVLVLINTIAFEGGARGLGQMLRRAAAYMK